MAGLGINVCLFDSRANDNVKLLSQQPVCLESITVADMQLLQVWDGITLVAGAGILSRILFAHWSKPMPEWLAFPLVFRSAC